MNPLFAVHPSVPDRRSPVSLESTPLGGGRDAAVYRVAGQPERAAKIWHHMDSGIDLRRARIEAMLARPPGRPPAMAGARTVVATPPLFAWPDAVLEDARGRCCGHLMPAVSGERVISLQQYLALLGQPKNPATASLHHDASGRRQRLQIGLHLSTAVAELHRLGHAVIHWQPARMALHWDSGAVCLMGTDEFSILGPDGRHFAAPLYPSDYLAPERLSDSQQDCHALAVLIYQLFHQGQLPPRPGQAAADGFDPGARALFAPTRQGLGNTPADCWREHFQQAINDMGEAPEPVRVHLPALSTPPALLPSVGGRPRQTGPATLGVGVLALVVAGGVWMSMRKAAPLSESHAAAQHAQSAQSAARLPPSAPPLPPHPPLPPFSIDVRLKADAVRARAMRTPDQSDALQARLHILPAAFARATDANRATLDNIQSHAWATEAPALQQLDDLRQFNSDFTQYADSWVRWPQPAADARQAALKNQREHRPQEALALMERALALDPQDPDTLIAAAQLALTQHKIPDAQTLSVYALSLPGLREHRRTFWLMQGLALLGDDHQRAAGRAALWMARSYAPSASEYCSELEASMAHYGAHLGAVVSEIARRVAQTEGDATPRICRTLVH